MLAGCRGSCLTAGADCLPTRAALVPPELAIVILDFDVLLADLLGHPLLAGQGVLAGRFTA